MIRFQVNGNVLVLDPATLLVPQFQALVDADPTPDKKLSHDALRYVYYMRELNMQLNPYAEMEEREREPYIRRFLFKGVKLTKEYIQLIVEASEAYEVCNENSIWAAVHTLDDEIRIQKKILDSEKNLSLHNAQLRKNISLGLEKMVESREKIRAIALADNKKVKNRGGVVTSPLEDKVIGLNTENIGRKPNAPSNLGHSQRKIITPKSLGVMVEDKPKESKKIKKKKDKAILASADSKEGGEE